MTECLLVQKRFKEESDRVNNINAENDQKYNTAYSKFKIDREAHRKIHQKAQDNVQGWLRNCTWSTDNNVSLHSEWCKKEFGTNFKLATTNQYLHGYDGCATPAEKKARCVLEDDYKNTQVELALKEFDLMYTPIKPTPTQVTGSVNLACCENILNTTGIAENIKQQCIANINNDSYNSDANSKKYKLNLLLSFFLMGSAVILLSILIIYIYIYSN